MTSLTKEWHVIEKDQLFGRTNRINSVNFNATSLKLDEKFDHPFSHVFIFGNIIAQGHGFDRYSHAIMLPKQFSVCYPSNYVAKYGNIPNMVTTFSQFDSEYFLT